MLSHYIINDIREALGVDRDDTSLDEEIMAMSPEEQFNLWCQWNGLLGWSYKLKTVVLELFKGKK